MGFHEIKDADGNVVGHAIVCGRGQKQRCQDCGALSDVLCDFPVTRNGKETTCDRKCCRRHCVSVGKDRDYCLPHHRHAEKIAQEAKS